MAACVHVNSFYDTLTEVMRFLFVCSVESMSLRGIGNPGDLSSRLMDNDKARDCIVPMG